MKIKTTEEIVKNFTIDKSSDQWVEFCEVKEMVKENKQLKAKLHKVERKLEYSEWKRITDKRGGK